MQEIDRPKATERFGRFLNIANFVRTQSARDKEAIASWGIRPDLQVGATRLFLIYAPAYFLDRFNTEELREMRFFELITKFVFYVGVIGDDILDNYGKVFTTVELSQKLEQAKQDNRHVLLTSEEFLSRGITSEQLSSPSRLLTSDMIGVDKVQLINKFMHDALDDNGLINNMPLSSEERQRLKYSFIHGFNFNFETYLLERKMVEDKGLENLTVDDWQAIANIKAAQALTSFKGVFSFFSRSEKQLQQIISAGEPFMMLAMYADDIKDLEIDWRRQPNVVSIIAKEFYPSEYAVLAEALQSGVNFYGIKGNFKLTKLIPHTLLHWRRLYFDQLRKAQETTVSLLPSVVLNFTSIASRRLRGTSMKDLPR